MSTSRFFHYAKKLSGAAALACMTDLAAHVKHQEFLEFQQKHPNVVIREKYHPMAQTGGYWTYYVDVAEMEKRSSTLSLK